MHIAPIRSNQIRLQYQQKAPTPKSYGMNVTLNLGLLTKLRQVARPKRKQSQSQQSEKPKIALPKNRAIQIHAATMLLLIIGKRLISSTTGTGRERKSRSGPKLTSLTAKSCSKAAASERQADATFCHVNGFLNGD